MSGIRLVAVTACQYDGQTYPPESIFTVKSRDHAVVLTTIRKATYATDEAESETAPVRRRRTYRRRDLTAEGSDAP